MLPSEQAVFFCFDLCSLIFKHPERHTFHIQVQTSSTIGCFTNLRQIKCIPSQSQDLTLEGLPIEILLCPSKLKQKELLLKSTEEQYFMLLISRVMGP